MTGQRVLTLTVGPMSHGGHCVARHEGRVVFVRHAIPGERIRAVLTEAGESARFWRADTVDVLQPSDHRRRHPWKQADALRAYDQNQVPVGGADYGHISDPHQRRLKSQVFRDTMARIGGIDLSSLELPHASSDGELFVEALSGATANGLQWRTRVSFAVHGGSLAMKPHRSHELIALRSMPLAVEAVAASHIFSWDFTGADTVDVVAAGAELPLTLVVHAPHDSAEALSRRLADQAQQDPAVGSVILALAAAQPQGRTTPAAKGKRRRRFNQLRPTSVEYRVITGTRAVEEPLPAPAADASGTAVELPAEGFWQIHRSAPQALVETVGRMADVRLGGSVVDLYAGAGLFSAWAAATVGGSGQVLSVEAAEATGGAAQKHFAAHPNVETVTAPVERVAHRLQPADLVLLDPPRAGADKGVLARISETSPGQIIYVSCDPASFARDAKRLNELGWQLRDVALLDMYPNTHHMESVALFET